MGIVDNEMSRPLVESPFSDDFMDRWSKGLEAEEARLRAEYDARERRPLSTKQPRPPAVKSGRFPAFLERVRQAAEMTLGTPPDEIGAEDVRDALVHLRSLFGRKRISVFRVMRVPDTFITGLKPGDELGSHWAWVYDLDNIEDFNTHRDYGGDVDMFLFEAIIDSSDIFLELTVAYNCVFPRENEVFLGGTRPTPTFQSVRRLDNRRQPSGENLRPDLVGKIMSA